MSSINSVSITGNLTRDPELRATQGGTSVLRLGVAVNERRQGAGGEWEDRPNFVDCVVFGRRADALSGLLSKGDKVAIEGSLRYSSWEKDGQRRSKLEVVAREVDLMQRSRGQGASQRPAASAAAPALRPAYATPAPAPALRPAYAAPAPAPQAPPEQTAIAYDVTDSDIPF